MKSSTVNNRPKFFCLFFLLSCVNYSTKIKVSASIPESKIIMNEKVLRVVVANFPPAIILNKKEENGLLPFSGSATGNLVYLAQALNISYKFIYVNESQVKKFGLVISQLNPVINGEADLMVMGLIANPERYKQLDVTVPAMIDPYRLVVPWPKEKSRLLAPVRPFQPTVWLCLVLSLVIMAPILNVITSLNSKYISDRNKIDVIDLASTSRNSIFLLSHLINQSYHYDLRSKSRGVFILVGIWLMMAVVLANAYAGTLFSFLSVAKLEPIINSLEELGNSQDVQLIIQDRSELANRFLNAKTGVEKLIGDTLRNNPENLISNINVVKNMLATGKYAFTFFDTFNYGFIDATYRENDKKCRLTLAREPVSFFAPVAYGLTKNSPYTKAIDEQIQVQFETGLYQVYRKPYLPRIDQCLMKNQKGSAAHSKSLALVDMSSAFVVLGLGISFSLLVFITEIIYKRIQSHYFSQSSRG